MSGGFHSAGEVRVTRAKIGIDLCCTDASFENPGGRALSGRSVEVGGDVLLGDGFSAKGEVELCDAKIGANLDCEAGNFENPTGDALSAAGATVGANVPMGGPFRTEGKIRLTNAKIDGRLECAREPAQGGILIEDVQYRRWYPQTIERSRSTLSAGVERGTPLSATRPFHYFSPVSARLPAPPGER